MLATLLAPKFIVLYAFIASAMYVHYRGRVRHGFFRQLTDHSSLMAPYNALMYLFSAVPNRPYVDVEPLSRTSRRSRDNWQTIRDEALQLFDEGRIRAAAKYNDLGFNSFFKTRLEALLRQVVRRAAAVGESAVPEDRRARAVDSRRQRGDVRAAAARQQARRAPRSVRRVAALSPRPRHAERRHLPDRRRRRAVLLARRRAGDVRRDIHPYGRKPQRRRADHPVLRRRAAAVEPRRAARSITSSKRR